MSASPVTEDPLHRSRLVRDVRDVADVVVVNSRACGKKASLTPTLRTIARTLRVSVRFLAISTHRKVDLVEADQLLHDWACDIFKYGTAKLTAIGREQIAPTEPNVVMSNHGSLIDIPALIATFPGTLRMVTKEELTRVPVWGKAMVAGGFIPINRRDRARAIEQLEVAKRQVQNGVAVWIAPEGTRSPVGELNSFKKGGFHLAHQLGAHIVPAYVHNAAELLPMGTWRARYDVDVRVSYGRPVPPSKDIQAQMDRVRSAIVELSDGRLNSTP